MDKLSEVKSVEEEEGREVEKKDKERKDKKRHINALKESEGTHLLRRTLKNAVRLYEQVPTDTNQKKDWEKQFSASPVKQRVNVQAQDDTTSGIFFSAEPQTPGITGRTPRLFNPLRFMVKSDEPKSRPQRVSGEERRATHTTEGLGMHVAGAEDPVGDTGKESKESVLSKGSPKDVGGSVKGSSRSVSLKSRLSTSSSPGIPTHDPLSTRRASFERTQSNPEGRGLFAKELSHAAQDTTMRLDTIAEDNTQTDQSR